MENSILEYWINIFINSRDDISCLAEDSHKNLQEAIDDAHDWRGWSYIHTVYFNRDEVKIIDLALAYAENKETAAIDRRSEELESSILRSQQIDEWPSK